MLHQLATVVLGPLLYLQGKAVRRTTPRLPEPPGPRQGTTGSGPLLRLLVLGDSAAAGVGAAHQDEALLGHLVAALSPNFRVVWYLFAETGATTASTLQRLQQLDDGPFDVVVTSLGVNDITSGLNRRQWLKQQAQLRKTLRNTFGVTQIIASGLPPVHGFPALPQPLRWYLGAIAREFDRDLAHSVETEDDVSFLSLRFTEDTTLMASDGFHPGPGVYKEWGKRASLVITALM
ncbi:MAG: SGNH/GDSL hydrolase family protein [Chloroflexota bacterium]